MAGGGQAAGRGAGDHHTSPGDHGEGKSVKDPICFYLVLPWADLNEVHGEGELLIVQHPVLVYVRQPPHLPRSNVCVKLNYCMLAVWQSRQISLYIFLSC